VLRTEVVGAGEHLYGSPVREHYHFLANDTEKMNRLKNAYVERVSAAGAYIPWGAKFKNSRRPISGITLNSILNSRSHFLWTSSQYCGVESAIGGAGVLIYRQFSASCIHHALQGFFTIIFCVNNGIWAFGARE
jgi:hypothetical protein